MASIETNVSITESELRDIGFFLRFARTNIGAQDDDVVEIQPRAENAVRFRVRLGKLQELNTSNYKFAVAKAHADSPKPQTEEETEQE